MTETARDLEAEILDLEREIARLRLAREKATYRLEQAVREQERLARHLVYIQREDGAA